MPVLRDEMKSVAQVLDAFTREGALYQRLEQGRVRCYACAHRCLIPAGQRGICQVRFNDPDWSGLKVPWGYVAALQCDPTEKKPFAHVLPGSRTLTFGMLGCDYHCGYCQNWLSSQALRDPAAGTTVDVVSPAGLVGMARSMGAHLVGSSYNEPLITAEWAVDVFRATRPQGFLSLFVSNGNGTREVLEYLRPWLDCYKVDLKSMNDRTYRKLGGVLRRVLDTIELAHALGFWEEVVTLVVPGFNDTEGELREAARFLASVSRDIPWHVTSFHKDYRMRDPDDTGPRSLVRAAEIGKEEGLRFVYAGNLPGLVGDFEHTCCPACGELLVRRYGYHIQEYRITSLGTCPRCGVAIPGVWWGDEGRPVAHGAILADQLQGVKAQAP